MVSAAKADTELHDLYARARIHDAIVQYARGVDRCDRELIVSAFHPGGYVDYGSLAGTPGEVADQILDMHLNQFICTSHSVSNEYVVIDGDVATAETYVQAVLRFERDGALFEITALGRYLDRFEQRDGDWRIVHRLVILDRDRIDPIVETTQIELATKLPGGTRGPDDPSYAYFPLTPTSPRSGSAG